MNKREIHKLPDAPKLDEQTVDKFEIRNELTIKTEIKLAKICLEKSVQYL